jgi:hypothetical protein
MRFAPQPVKLQFDNVGRFPIEHLVRGAGDLVLKNTANTGLFARIAPFQRICGVATGSIDENRSLPYKPRQLSAMARFDRGGSFGPETARFGRPALADLPH